MKSSLAQCIAGGACTSEIRVRFPEATSLTGSPSKPIFMPKTDPGKYAKHTIKLPQPYAVRGIMLGTAEMQSKAVELVSSACTLHTPIILAAISNFLLCAVVATHIRRLVAQQPKLTQILLVAMFLLPLRDGKLLELYEEHVSLAL